MMMQVAVLSQTATQVTKPPFFRKTEPYERVGQASCEGNSRRAGRGRLAVSPTEGPFRVRILSFFVYPAVGAVGTVRNGRSLSESVFQALWERWKNRIPEEFTGKSVFFHGLHSAAVSTAPPPFSDISFGPSLAHGTSLEFDAMGIVNETV